jgi:hypothetical protein
VRNQITQTVDTIVMTFLIMMSIIAAVAMGDFSGKAIGHRWSSEPPTQIHIVYDDDVVIRPVERECKPFRIMDAAANEVFTWQPGPDCETGGHIRLGRYYMPRTNVAPDADDFFPVPGPPEDSWMGER